ncbi:hypothetical protein [Streptomyces flaveolus]|uniref:hypothetical protein n=1 Tax=Streptomyces flaveolus TaxID=67297 RepID=UPI0036F739B0
MAEEGRYDDPGELPAEEDITLRTVKRMGRLLDEGGRARGHVPITAAAAEV